ncbi:MAG: hypothetical protein EZS28_049878 [Streblomastix strix]|uniref:Uncharacterized protein n=2 Tax=Streblomastix strix TaxID=222440 RepID=A0A5J4TAY2_9EUKA|nr:MAG: hypothetical protein EZS28_049878 [Streblomastix strix]
MGNFEEGYVNDIVQCVVNEYSKVFPSTTKQIKKKLDDQSCKRGKGLVGLNVSCDVLGFAHNITCQHIRNIKIEKQSRYIYIFIFIYIFIYIFFKKLY